MKTISTLKSDISSKLHGRSLSRVSAINGTIAEAGRRVIARIDPKETLRTAEISNSLAEEVQIFPAPPFLKGDKIVDFGNEGSGGDYEKVTTKGYSRGEQEKAINVSYKNGVKVLHINQASSLSSKQNISLCNDLTGWAASDSAENLTLDTSNFISKEASLNFDIAINSVTAVVENSTLSPIDLSTLGDEYVLHTWVYIPTPSQVSSITLRLGSSGVNYISGSVTGAYGSSSFQEGWNQISVDLSSGTVVGTVDFSSISYFQLQITHDQTGGSDYRLDSVLVSQKDVRLMKYYSNAIFQGLDGTLKTGPTADTDMVILEEDAYNIVLYECVHSLSQELQGENGSFDESYFRGILHGTPQQAGLYAQYEASYPSENMKAKSTYYTIRRGNYR